MWEISLCIYSCGNFFVYFDCQREVVNCFGELVVGSLNNQALLWGLILVIFVKIVFHSRH